MDPARASAASASTPLRAGRSLEDPRTVETHSNLLIAQSGGLRGPGPEGNRRAVLMSHSPLLRPEGDAVGLAAEHDLPRHPPAGDVHHR